MPKNRFSLSNFQITKFIEQTNKQQEQFFFEKKKQGKKQTIHTQLNESISNKNKRKKVFF